MTHAAAISFTAVLEGAGAPLPWTGNDSSVSLMGKVTDTSEACYSILEESATMAQLTGRILGLDFGKRRIGLAISDALGLTAQPLSTYTRTRVRQDIAYLVQLAQEREIVLFVFGDPKYMSGDESRQSASVKEFAARLQLSTRIPIIFWDERLTSTQAHRLLDEEGGLKREDRKGKVDQIAASLILDGYLISLEHR